MQLLPIAATIGRWLEEVVVAAGVVAPELVPAALLLVAGALDEVARHDDEIGVAKLDLLDVLLVADRLAEEVLVAAAALALGPPGALGGLRRGAGPLPEAGASADERLAVGVDRETDGAIGLGRGCGAEGVGVRRIALRHRVLVLGVGLETGDPNFMPPVAGGIARRVEDRGRLEGELAAGGELRRRLVVEHGVELRRAREDERLGEARSGDRDLARDLLDREPREEHPVESGILLIGQHAEVADQPGRVRGRRQRESKGDRARGRCDQASQAATSFHRVHGALLAGAHRCSDPIAARPTSNEPRSHRRRRRRLRHAVGGEA